MMSSAFTSASSGLLYAPHVRRFLDLKHAAAASTDEFKNLATLTGAQLQWIDVSVAESAPLGVTPLDCASGGMVITVPAFPAGKYHKMADATSDDGAESFLAAPRVLRCAADYPPVAREPIRGTLPRCGASGHFYVEEQAVFDLMTAQLQMPRKIDEQLNPFWIPEDYADLRSGWLNLLSPDLLPAMIAGTAMVFPASILDDLSKLVDAAIARKATTMPPVFSPAYQNAATRVPGMNAMTGKVSSANDYLTSSTFGDGAAGWVTMEQVAAVRARLACTTLDAGAVVDQLDAVVADADGDAWASEESGDAALWRKAIGGAHMVQLSEAALYNAAQLEKPGRLGLIRSGNRNAAPNAPLFV